MFSCLLLQQFIRMWRRVVHGKSDMKFLDSISRMRGPDVILLCRASQLITAFVVNFMLTSILDRTLQERPTSRS